ncbi:MAG: histone family protein DNA-binding protein [uncultured bacterium]|nr:MAG: histone family protein DNA-binding protein [uncultured bacterium]
MAAKKASARSKGKSMKKRPAKAMVKTAPKRTTIPVVKDPLTKSGILRALTDMTALPKKDVAMVLDGVGTLIELHVKSRGPGKFIMPGLIKIHVIKKPARPARKGRNPFTGEEVMFKAKPARRVVKIRALRKLKDMAL